MTKAKIKKLESTIPGLMNDAKYWDLRCTYGDYHPEVLRYLQLCAKYRRASVEAPEDTLGYMQGRGAS